MTDTICTAFLYDLLATFIVFVISYFTNNSTWYDPYWSLAPIPLSVYFTITAVEGYTPRLVLILILVSIWGGRLTYNWAIGFIQGHGATSEHKQDWRYISIQHKFNSIGLAYLYWPIGSLLCIHLLPTLLVFMGCCSIHVAMHSSLSFGLFDVLGTIVTITAVLIEAVADEQLRTFTKSVHNKEAVLKTGLWRYSRHPNYFGENLFWIGLYIIAIGTAPEEWKWLLTGPISMGMLFNFISIPLLEKRQVAKRPYYKIYQTEVSRFVPWFSNVRT